jgi:choline-sulfatase
MMCASCSNKGSVPEKPKIIFIIADDQSPLTLKAYGNEVCQTPHLDRLAAEGMVLDAAYHSMPVVFRRAG